LCVNEVLISQLVWSFVQAAGEMIAQDWHHGWFRYHTYLFWAAERSTRSSGDRKSATIWIKMCFYEIFKSNVTNLYDGRIISWAYFTLCCHTTNGQSVRSCVNNVVGTLVS
jgi:hypothetical protein